ncbi:MAG TPA: hypothetical protein ENJ82_05365 [Bacteroidetes bacterium]|nr:hypothetical protein [Bacteroidota bacterium]
MKHSFCLALICCLFLASCTPVADNKGDDSNSPDPEVVKVEPQDFPVNKIPESQFGKAANWEEVMAINLPDAANLVASDTKFPDWLDAIISRESIVLFANKVLSSMSEEVEFVQSGQQHLTGPDGWNAFYVHFNTRPSNGQMVIFGGYKSETEVYWGSDFGANAISMAWTRIAPSEMGVELMGTGYYGGQDKTATFEVDLGEEAIKLKRAM